MTEVQKKVESSQLPNVSPIEHASFQLPPILSSKTTLPNMQVIYHGIKSPSKFVRVHVLRANNPLREAYVLNSEKDSNEWKTELIFFAFESQMPSTVEFDVTYANDPYRTRILSSKIGRKAMYDLTQWYSFDKNDNALSKFHTYPMKTSFCTHFHVDFEANPDRYFIDTSVDPGWKRFRCFSFSAYKGSKFFVLECQNPLRYKIVERFDYQNKVEVCEIKKDQIISNWKCILSFYAFKDKAPGTNEYYVQESYEPHHRTRVSMIKNKNDVWKDITSFWAWDLPMPDTSRFAIQFLTPDVDENRAAVEQSRIYIKDCWGRWQHKLYFYAFASARV